MTVAGGNSDEDGLGRWQPADSRFRLKSAFGGRCAVCTRIHSFSADLVDMVQEVAWILVDADGACLP